MLTKQNLEQMLNLLDVTTLEKIDSKCSQDGYTYGQQPMLKYSPEALVEYACAIYRYILPHFDTTGITEEDYISKWTALHTKAMKLIASKDYMLTLSNIVAAPEPAPEGYSLEKDIYSEISAYLDNHKTGAEWYFFEGLNDFLTNVHSPLRWNTVTDKRIIDLIYEVDSIRDACNKELDTFISKELKPYIHLIQERLAYYKIKPKTIAALKVSKDQIPPLDWAEISQALENKIIPENTRKLITANLKALRKTAKAKKAKKPVSAKLDPSIVVDANEVFIREFISKLGVAYAIPVIKDPEEPTTTEILDALYNTIDVLTLANTQGTSIDAVEDQQKSSELWYSDFNNIVQPLAACLEISLNNISPETVLSDEALSHGAIKAMLAFAKTPRLKVLYKLNANIIDYTELSKELHHQIQVNTNYYTDAEPLPEVVPMSKVQLIDSVSKGTAPILPSLFDLTPPIQDVLDSIKANAVTTGAIKVLSDSDVKSIVPMLVPVNDYTIKEIANMLTGQASTPYLADGALVIHTIETGKYLKVVPIIVETKYAEYQFRSYNWDTLNGHIRSLQQLLAKTTEYIKWQAKGTQKHSYKLLSKAVELRKIAIKEAEELYEFLLDLANRTFDDVDNDDDAKAMKAIRKITSTHYYKDFIRISGHRLSAWVYYPEDYRLISNPPIDANGYEIDYEPNHINGVRSDNRPSNLKIELKQVNLDLRSTSRPVKYNGQPYLTLKKYCDAFGLSYDYLRTHLPSLQPGETKEHDNGSIKRAYCLDADGWTYIATDVAITITATQLVYSGKEYATPKEFAADLGLDYEKIRQGLYRAKKKNKTEYKCKEKNKTYTFYLDKNGNVTKIL